MLEEERFMEICNSIDHIKMLALKIRDERDGLQDALRDCINELCLKCGNYKQRHHGACDDCRWYRRM